MPMNRQRPLPPDIFTDERLIELPTDVRLTAIGLRLHADDHGRETATPWMLKASIWPGHPDVTEDTIIEHLLAIEASEYIGIYHDESRSYYALREWPSVSHPAPSKHPAPPPELFQKSSGRSPEDFAAWEREGERARAGEWARGESPDGFPPSPFCTIHQPNGTRNNCRHCGTARLAQEQWIREHREDYPDA